MADQTVGLGWDSSNHGRQDSRIWMGFYKSKQTKQYYLDGILQIMSDKTVGFVWDSTNHSVL